MLKFETMRLPAQRTDVAPDGSDARVLLHVGAGGRAHFELRPRQTSKAVRHRTVEEISHFVGDRGQMWRSEDGRSEVVDAHAGTCLTIPIGTHFRLRPLGFEPLAAIGVTMPNWPGEAEAISVEACPD